jgi:anhydro-N-acetylmuramic acid kinase
LATVFHVWVFAQRGRHVCVNNLGGISNVTSLDWRAGHAPSVLAFDTGPANVLLDVAVRHFTPGRQQMDQNGRRAARGQADEQLLTQWLKHEFFRRPPPKSTGRELFGEPFFDQALVSFKRVRQREDDLLATFTELTARSIAVNYHRHLPAPPDTVMLTGGGAENRFLVQRLGHALAARWPAVKVITGDAAGWPSQSIEPAAFALLAWLRWHGLPGNLPATTGARHAALCGQITEIEPEG